MIQTQFERFYVVLAFLLLMLVALSGCVRQKFASEPYPRWGEEYSIPRPKNNPPLILRVLPPPESVQPAACVLLVHGMHEYIGRYGDVARRFSEQFLVAGIDYYAHGLSNPVLQQADTALTAGAGKQDVSQAFSSQTSLSDLEPARYDFGLALKKTVQICDAQHQEGPKKPVFIVAHSLGSLIAASYLLQEKNSADWIERVQGVVFLGPGFAVSELPGWRGWLANPLIKLSFHTKAHFLHPHDEPLPVLLFNQLLSLVTVPVLDGLFEMFSWPVLRNFMTPSTPEWVVEYQTDNQSERKRLIADSWIIRRSLLRYVKGVEGEIVRFHRHMDAFSIPYFLVYSEQDPITPAWGNQAFISATLDHHSDNRQLSLPGLPYHQHLFLQEPRRSEILQHIEQWLQRRVHTVQQHEKDIQ